MISREKVRLLLSDIRFWIVFFFLLRLIGITNAPLEVSHNWRQTFTNMIARNFLETGPELLYPRIDMAGEKSGIIGSEFPFFQFLIYLVSLVFDYSHWYGRLINLVVSSFGLLYFFKTVKGIITPRVAFSSTIVLAVSIWFAFSRKIMPDTFSVSLVIIGLYHGYNYLKVGRTWSLLYFFFFSTLGMLCKIPALSLFSLVAIPFFISSIPLNKKVRFYAASVVAVAIPLAWYFFWAPHLVDTYGYQLFFPKSFSEGVGEIAPLIPELLNKFYFSSLKSYVAFLCFLVGLVFLFRSGQRWVKIGFVLVSLVFGAFIIKTGAVFPLHNYYIIPFTPMMALVAGYFLAGIQPKFRYALLGLIVIEGVANQQHDFFIKESQKFKLSLGEKVEDVVPQNSLIVINGGQSTQHIYFANRNGWTVFNEDLAKPGYLDSLSSLGAEYLIVDRNALEKKFPPHQLQYSDEDYLIYELEE